MKRFSAVFLCFIFLLAGAWYGDAEACWEACGETMEDAREGLVSQIGVVKVESETVVKKFRKVETFLGRIFPVGSSSVEHKIRSSIKFALVKTRTINEGTRDGKICLRVCEGDLEDYAAKLFKRVSAYEIESLTSDPKGRIKKINEWIDNIELAINFALVFGDEDEDDFKKLDQMLKKLKDELSKLHGQFVIITFDLPGAVLILDGKQEKLGKKIFLPAGMHSYIIKAQGVCDIKDDFKLKKGKDETITVSMAGYAYPEVTFISDREDLTLKVEGSLLSLDTPRIIKRCDGDINYTVRYSDVNEGGSIKLKPGLKKTVRVGFDYDKVKKMCGVFTKGNSIEAGYSFLIPGSEFDDLENIHKFNLGFYKNYRFFRIGAGGSYGKTEDSFIADGYLSLVFQLSEIGKDSRPLHFRGYFPVIPFAEFDLGIGYHDIYDEKTKSNIDTFRTEDDYEEDDFKRDHCFLRWLLGLSIPVNDTIGLKFFYGKSLYMEEGSELGTSVVFSF